MADLTFDDLLPPVPAATPTPQAKPAVLAFDDLIPAAPAARDATTVQNEYDALPWYGKAAQAADDVARKLANGATFGYADKLSAYMDGTSAEEERAKTEEAAIRGGSAATAAELAGAIMTPGLVASTGASLPRLAASARGVTGTLVRSGLAAVEGAGYGTLNAAGHDEDLAGGAIGGAAGGALGNAAGEAIATGAHRAAGLFNRAPHIPDMDELTTAARRAYDAADNAGVIFTPQATSRLQQNVYGALADMGYDPALQPGAAAIVRRLEDLQGQNVSLKGLDTLRKVAANGYIPGNKSNNAAVAQILGHINDLVGNSQPGHVLAGNAQAAADALTAARGYWARLAKADTVARAAAKGELNAAAAGSGANVENTSRQSMKNLANRSGATRGFTGDEQDALLTAIRGTPDQNALRLVGKLSPSGIVSGGLSSGLGYGVAGPVGAVAAPAVGYAARKGAEAMQRNNVQELLDVIMAGGTKAATKAAPNAVQRGIAASRDDVVRALAAAGQYEGSR